MENKQNLEYNTQYGELLVDSFFIKEPNLYEEFSKIVYAASLQDSNDIYCPEIVTDIDILAKYSRSKIEIVKGLHREKAIKCIKK